MNMKFHIVSDSSCDLGAERARRLGVELVSYYVALGDEHYYREEKDISTHEFYQRMADNPGIFPKTSMPTIQDYLEVFRPAARQGLPILCICLNAPFSGSIQSARNAAEELQEEVPRARVYVMDSQSATVLQGLLVEEAALLRDMGTDLEEAVEQLEAVRSSGPDLFYHQRPGVPAPRRPHRKGGGRHRHAAEGQAPDRIQGLRFGVRRNCPGAEAVPPAGAGAVLSLCGAQRTGSEPVAGGHRLRAGRRGV